MRLPGGGSPRISDETRQFAFIMLGVVLLVFFLLVVRMLWDRRNGAQPIDVRVLTNRAYLQKALIGGQR